MTRTRPAGRFAICAGGTTATLRVVRDATRPCRSVVVVHSSRSPARVDQNSRSSRSRVPPKMTTAPVLFKIVAALCSHPAGQQLRAGLESGADRHPTPAHVRGPGLQRDRGDQGRLVQEQSREAGRSDRRGGRRPGGGLRGRCAPSTRTPAVRPGSPRRPAGTPRRPTGQQLLDVEPDSRLRGGRGSGVGEPPERRHHRGGDGGAGAVVGADELLDIASRTLPLRTAAAARARPGRRGRVWRPTTGRRPSSCDPARRRAGARPAPGGPGRPRTPGPPTHHGRWRRAGRWPVPPRRPDRRSR